MREVTRLTGINVHRYRLICLRDKRMTISQSAGYMSDGETGSWPTIGDGYELDAIAACVIRRVSAGRRRRPRGASSGTGIVGVINNGMTLLNSNHSAFGSFVTGCVIVTIGSHRRSEKQKNKVTGREGLH